MAALPSIAADFEVDGIAYYINYGGTSVSVAYNNYVGDVVIPESVSHNGISYSVTAIGGGAFMDCSNLTSVSIPNSVVEIKDTAFKNCTGLSSIIIPNGVEIIYSEAFYGCSNLTSIIIPASVMFIYNNSFYGCPDLTNIVVDSGNTVYDSRENCNAIIDTSDNNLIVGCKNTTIPNTVEMIEAGAFYGCSGLTSINIPNSVTIIFDCAFSGCSGMTDIFSNVKNPYYVYLGYNVFYDVHKDNCTLHVPRNTVSLYRECEQWNDFVHIVDDIYDGILGDFDDNGMVDVEDVNAAINIILKLKDIGDYPGIGDMDGNGIIDVEDVNAIINIILKVNTDDVDLPKAMSVAANYNDTGCDTILDMVQVWGAGNIFWHLVYIDEKGIMLSQKQDAGSYVVDYADINVMGDRADEIIDANGMIASNNPGWYLMIVTTSITDNKIKYDVQFNNPEVWMIGPITPMGYWAELEEGCMFSVPDQPDGEFVSPPFARSVPGGDGDGVRAFVKIPGYDWWKSEFMIYGSADSNGYIPIEYRGMGCDQNEPEELGGFGYRVAGNKGQRMYFNFTKELGKIE